MADADIFSQVRQHRDSGDDEYTQMNIVLDAVTEAIQSKGASQITPVGYFAALLVALQNETQEQNILAMLKLLSIVIEKYILSLVLIM